MAGTPTYARRRVGAELRRWRTAVDLSGEDAADACGWDKSKISRIENAKVALSPRDLRRLCKLYGLESAEAFRLETLLTEPSGPRWWARYADFLNPAYEELICLESQASSVHAANANLVVGLLQTRNYATAVMTSGPSIPDPDHGEALVEVRMKRQQVLVGDRPIALDAVVSEAALMCEIGGRKVLAEQLEHLLDITTLPNVDLHVLPVTSTANAFNGGLTLYGFPEPHAPGVLFIEYHAGTLIRDEERDIRRHQRQLDYLIANSLTVQESREHISRRLKTL